MERKKLTIWLFMALTASSYMVYAADEKQKQQSITTPRDRLQDIEKYIPQSREMIELYYANRLKLLKLQAEEEIKLFEKSEMDALASAAVPPFILLATRGFIPPNYIEDKNGLMLPKEQVALAESRIAEKKKEILKSLELDITSLEKRKKHSLTVGLADIEKHLKEDALRPKPKPTHGVVRGIVYGKDKQIALIDKEMVGPGETIHGVKVVKIHADSVEFEMNGKVWKQKVRETAGKLW
ncbi:MAG: hypothetical protein ACYTEQ_13215 [Planctomycetota bacterium]|jgi:hypothetical protein